MKRLLERACSFSVGAAAGLAGLVLLVLAAVAARVSLLMGIRRFLSVPISQRASFEIMLGQARSGDLFLIDSPNHYFWLKSMPSALRPCLDAAGHDNGFTHVGVLLLPPVGHSLSGGARVALYSSTSACAVPQEQRRMLQQCVHLQDVQGLIDADPSARFAWRRIGRPLDRDRAFELASRLADPGVVEARPYPTWVAPFFRSDRAASMLVRSPDAPAVCSGTVLRFYQKMGVARPNPWAPFRVCPQTFSDDRLLQPLLLPPHTFGPLVQLHGSD